MSTIQIQRQLWSPPCFGAGDPPGVGGRGGWPSGRCGLTVTCYAPTLLAGDRGPGAPDLGEPAAIVHPVARPGEPQENARARRGAEVTASTGARAGFFQEDPRFLDLPGAPPADRRDGWFWLLMVGVGFIVGQVVALLLVDVAAAAVGKGQDLSAIAKLAVPPEWYVASSLVGLWVGFGGAPWLASRVRGTKHFAEDLGLRFRWPDLFGIVIGAGGQLVVSILYLPFRSHLHNFNGPTNKLTGGAHGGGFVLIAVLTVVGAPFFEELFFRGLLFRSLARLLTPVAPGPSRARAYGLAAAVVVDGLLFGLAHFEAQQFAGLAVFGMLLALTSYRTGRLGMNMVAHGTFNLIAVLAVLNTRGGIIH